jgi:hypothetical protein
MIGRKLRKNRHPRSNSSTTDLKKTRINNMVIKIQHKIKDIVQCKYGEGRINWTFSTSTKHKSKQGGLDTTIFPHQKLTNKVKTRCKYCTKNSVKTSPRALLMTQESKRKHTIMNKYRKENMKPGNKKHG